MSIAEKLTTIAENEQKVYDAGKQAEYDAFWDAYMNYGKPSSFRYLFGNSGWTNDTFKPKYDIVPSGNATSMFMNSTITNVKKSLNDCGVVLDTSKATNISYFFGTTSTIEVPFMDISSATDSSYLFYHATNLETVEGIRFSENNTFSGFATNCTKLKNLTASGVIAKSISFSACTLLTAESAISIINTLKNYAGTSNEGTYKLTLASDVWARLDNTTPPEGYTSWRNYTESKGWLT